MSSRQLPPNMFQMFSGEQQLPPPDPIDVFVRVARSINDERVRFELVKSYLPELAHLTGQQAQTVISVIPSSETRYIILELLVTSQKLCIDVDTEPLLHAMLFDPAKIKAVTLLRQYNLFPKSTTVLTLQHHFNTDKGKLELFKLFLTRTVPIDQPPPPYSE